jgi:hypothetical protein
MVAGGWWRETRGEALSSTSHQPPFFVVSEKIIGLASWQMNMYFKVLLYIHLII